MSKLALFHHRFRAAACAVVLALGPHAGAYAQQEAAESQEEASQGAGTQARSQPGALDPGGLQSLLEGQPAGDPSAEAVMAQRRDLARQIEEAQRSLAAARERFAGTAQAETYDVAAQLLEISRLRLMGNASVDDEQARSLISDAMNRIQLRLDAMRATARRSSQPDEMSARIEALQERLDLARQRFREEDPAREPADPGIERVERLYDIAQQKLNEAYARAAEMPDAGHLIERLDAAQRRLNQARAGFEARVAPEVD